MMQALAGLAKAPAQFNGWAAETVLPCTHLSRIAAMSIGPDLAAEQLLALAGGED